MTTVQRHHFTVDDLYRMTRAGILDEDDRVELIDGEIVEMSPIGTQHMAVVSWLTHLFVRELGERATVYVQNCIRISDRHLLQPDVALLRWRDDYYSDREPRPADTVLLIEICDTSLAYDRRKLPLYANAGVPEIWLIDLDTDTLHVHREPAGERYTQVSAHRGDDAVSPEAFGDLTRPAGQHPHMT